jgi:hypothetical protein
MSDVDSNPLDPDVRDALEVERVNVIAPGEAKARVFGRLADTLGGRPGGDEGGSGDGRGATAAPSGGALAGVRAIARPLSLAVSFGLGSVAGIVAWRATHAPPAPQIVYVDREPATASASPTVDAAAPAPIPSAQSTVPTPSLSSGSPGNSLVAERGLLDVARSAFGRGDGDAALAALARHEKLYPGGQLAEEREALAVRALVLVDRGDQARARAARFRRRYPSSVMLPAVEAALGTIP